MCDVRKEEPIIFFFIVRLPLLFGAGPFHQLAWPSLVFSKGHSRVGEALGAGTIARVWALALEAHPLCYSLVNLEGKE